MSVDHLSEYLILIVALWFIGKAFLFYALWDAGRTDPPPERRTPFGQALRGLFGGLTFTSLSLGAALMLRYFAGPDGLRIEPDWVAFTIRLVMLISLIDVTVYGVRLYAAVVERKRVGREYVISDEGVFHTLARAMPIVVANSIGIIQHTTPAFDDLSGYEPRELIGQDLKVIMPDRYKHRHDGGMARYVATREARIVGTVVIVEMLRKDGTEVPVYLALNTADVEGEPFFVAALWQKDPETPDTLIFEHQRQRTERQDARDERQDNQQIILDKTSLDLTRRGEFFTVAGLEIDGKRVSMDIESHDLDVREDEIAGRENAQGVRDEEGG